MDENTFWLAFWKVAIAGVAILVVSVASCTSNTNYQKRLSLENGVDPLLVACVFEHENNQSCLVAATLQRK